MGDKRVCGTLNGGQGRCSGQDEYAHQVDFFLLTPSMRAELQSALGAKAWCYEDAAVLAHSDQGCERFTSVLPWAYWQSRDNAYRPTSTSDESAAMAPAKFRSLLATLIGTPLTGRG